MMNPRYLALLVSLVLMGSSCDRSEAPIGGEEEGVYRVDVGGLEVTRRSHYATPRFRFHGDSLGWSC